MSSLTYFSAYMTDGIDKFVDDVVLKWIKDNDDHLKNMYEAYLEEDNESACTFDEFAVYIFYEYNH